MLDTSSSSHDDNNDDNKGRISHNTVRTALGEVALKVWLALRQHYLRRHYTTLRFTAATARGSSGNDSAGDSGNGDDGSDKRLVMIALVLVREWCSA